MCRLGFEYTNAELTVVAALAEGFMALACGFMPAAVRRGFRRNEPVEPEPSWRLFALWGCTPGLREAPSGGDCAGPDAAALCCVCAGGVA